MRACRASTGERPNLPHLSDGRRTPGFSGSRFARDFRRGSEAKVRALEIERRLKLLLAKARHETYGQSSERAKLIVEQLELATPRRRHARSA